MKNILKSSKSKILLLIALCIITALIFLLIGITSKNIGFFIPKRIEKIIAFLLVSYAIAYSSIAFQTITNNHLLTPSVMGLDSLYLFIQTVIVFFLGSKSIQMLSGLTNYFISIGIMIIASLILFGLLFRKEGKSIYFLLLTGLVFGTFFGGLSSFMQVLLDPNEFLLIQGKMFASFSKINSSLLLISVVITTLVFLSTLLDFNKLDGLSLGKDQAISLGIDYKKTVLKTLIAISVLTSVATALVGPVTFLGIIITSLVRQIFVTYKHKTRVFGGVLVSFVLLVGGMILVERVFNFDTTVSVIINLVGGIYFIFLILREAKR